LEPLEIKVVMSIFVLLGILLFAKEFDPTPREAFRNVHVSLLMLSIAVPHVVLNWRKWRSDLSGAAPFGIAVLYAFLSVWLGDKEPHRLIPWFLHPMAVFVAITIVAVFRGTLRATRTG
jgi:ABC-type sugar transport system permease subunit